jgi:hypothetical protein
MIAEIDPTEAPLTDADALGILHGLPTATNALGERLRQMPGDQRAAIRTALEDRDYPSRSARHGHLIHAVAKWQRDGATTNLKRAIAEDIATHPAPSLGPDPLNLAAVAAAAARPTPAPETTVANPLLAALQGAGVLSRLRRGRILIGILAELAPHVPGIVESVRAELAADGSIDPEDIARISGEIGAAAGPVIAERLDGDRITDSGLALLAEHAIGLLWTLADGLAERRLGVWIQALRVPLRRANLPAMVAEMLGDQNLRGEALAVWAYAQGERISDLLPDRDALPQAHREAALGHLAALIAVAVSEGIGNRG